MDGKGRAADNIWIERFWKSIKYDYVYLNPADNFELYQGIDEYMAYYNEKIHHTTPAIIRQTIPGTHAKSSLKNL